MRKVAAILKIRDAAKMTPAQARAFKRWLSAQVDKLANDRGEYGQSYTAKLYRDA